MSLSTTLTAVADHLAGGADRFTELDAAAGDGDLGLTVTRIADAVRDTAAGLEQPTTDDGYREALLALGKAVASRAPSTFGTLTASSILAAAGAMTSRGEQDRLVAGLTAAVENVRRRGRSDVGERTLLDALVPAVEALQDGRGLSAAADAAEAGAEATASMPAKHGRAAWIGERTLGHPDAGATVVAALFRGLADAG